MMQQADSLNLKTFYGESLLQFDTYKIFVASPMFKLWYFYVYSELSLWEDISCAKTAHLKKKARPRMYKLLILGYDHNQNIWYQNLAKKAFLVL